MSTTKVAIVTAAGRGMGAAIAKELAAHNYGVALMSPSGAAEKLAQSLNGVGLTGSVTDPADLQQLVERTMARFGRIDGVVNHTGHPAKGPLLEIPDEDWHAGLDLVMLNVIRMARLITPIMQQQGSGAIVNISTYGVFEPEPAFPVSGAMRAALAGFTKLYADPCRKAKSAVPVFQWVGMAVLTKSPKRFAFCYPPMPAISRGKISAWMAALPAQFRMLAAGLTIGNLSVTIRLSQP
jgi:NAD(P)-dependent dehydrogenase (short-subunit alcohol dehydrogenase family)